MKHMDTLTIDGTHVAPILRDERREAIVTAMLAADTPVRRFGFGFGGTCVITYVHLRNGNTDAAAAAEAIAGLGWRNTDIVNIDGMLAITTTP